MDPQQVPTTSSLLSPPDLTPLEQEVLDEYERLAENMRKVSLTPQPPVPLPLFHRIREC